MLRRVQFLIIVFRKDPLGRCLALKDGREGATCNSCRKELQKGYPGPAYCVLERKVGVVTAKWPTGRTAGEVSEQPKPWPFQLRMLAFIPYMLGSQEVF